MPSKGQEVRVRHDRREREVKTRQSKVSDVFIIKFLKIQLKIHFLKIQLLSSRGQGLRLDKIRRG